MKDDRVDEGWRYRPLALFALVLFVFGACDGGGCDCEGFSEAPFPEEHYDKTVPISAEVRVTDEGLDFMASEVDNLIDEATDDGLRFCLPPTEESGASICHEDTVCDDGSTGCQLDLEIVDAEFTPEEPNRLIVHLVIGGLLADLPLNALGASCWLHLFSDSGGEDEPATIPVTVPVAFEVDPESELNDIMIELGDIDADLDDVDYNMSGRDSWDITCGSLNFGVQTFLDSTLRDLLTDELDNVVDDVVSEQLCRNCEGDASCPSNSSCVEHDEDEPPRCMYNEDDCVPTLLGVEGLLELEALVGDFLVHRPADVSVTGRVADRAVADTGLSLGVRVGTEPEFRGTCIDVEASPRPSFDPIDPSPSINADLKPNGDPFMFGIGVHRRTVQHLLWSIWASSALCVEVGSEQSDLLNTSTFEAFLDSVGDIAPQGGPMKIRLAPQLAPDVEFGANVVDGSDVEEGLLILDWQDLDIHMYGFVQQRYARLFTLRVDLELPVALMPDGDSALVPVIGEFEEAIQNIRVLNDNLTNEDVETFEDLIPTLVGLALPQLLDDISDPIELPDLLGYQLTLEEGDITSVDQDQVLAIFASLTYVGTEAESEAYSLMPHAVVSETEVIVNRDSERRAPTVDVVLNAAAQQGGSMLVGDDVEYLYSLNGSHWRLAGSGPRLRLQDPQFRLQGEHQISLRARPADVDGARWQRAPTQVPVIVDYEAPTLELWQQADRVQMRVQDAVDDRSQLQMRHRFEVNGQSGTWSHWASVDELDLRNAPDTGGLAVDVEIRDRAGHVTQESLEIRRQALVEERTTGGPGDSERHGCGGCGAANSGAPPWALVVLVLAFGALRMRRRWKVGAAALMVVALAATGCSGCSDEASENESEGECQEACEGDEVCIDGQCVVPGCEDDAECSATCGDDEFGVCDDGDCGCESYCADGCGEDQFCCYDTDACIDIPDPCAGESCDDGYETEVVEPGSYDKDACEPIEGQCECVAMPPIPMRYHGSYPSLGEGGEVTALSVHNLGYGDLMVGIIGGDKSGIQEWYVVDGIPDGGTIGGDPNGFRQGVLTNGPRVGTHTATAVDASERIHVFYRSVSDESLRYARGERAGQQWEFETVDVEVGDVDSGYYSEVYLRDGILHLFYTVIFEVEDEQEEGEVEVGSELRYRAIDVDHPVEDMAQTDFEVLHAGITDREGLGDHPHAAALFMQAVEDSEGMLFLSFYDNIRRQAGWLMEGQEQWGEPEFLDDQAGPYVSARPDAEGDVHVAFMDEDLQALVYHGGSVTRELVVDGIRDNDGGYSETPVGHDVQLFVDGEDISLLYHDASTHQLKRAIRDDEDGIWEVEVLAGEAGAQAPAHGLFVRALAQGDQWLVVDFTVDTTGEEAVAHPTLRFID